ncbi:MAG: methylated-DNA--[protein]-cysteine S-methyltransferase [Myxococcales bacterium]|nr:methylated-DNA--[protein]-cysteine S-methyltransferase [Myxococcales bacterium]
MGGAPPAAEGLTFGVFDGGNLGWMRLGWGAAALSSLDFLDEPPHEAARASPAPPPEIFGEPLRAYLRGEPEALLGVPIELEGTPFERRVWEALRRIPWGHVRSYGEIASEIGSHAGMRAVGQAAGKNPIAIVIPCHRVVAAGHRLGGFSAGLERKRWLLEHEGVVVDADRVHPGQLDLFGSFRRR